MNRYEWSRRCPLDRFNCVSSLIITVNVSSYPDESVATFVLAQLVFGMLSKGVRREDDASTTLDSSQVSHSNLQIVVTCLVNKQGQFDCTADMHC
jgi:hypothetical protein